MFVILVTANRDFAHITQFEESARVGGALCATGLGSRRDSASLTLSSAPVGPRVLKPAKFRVSRILHPMFCAFNEHGVHWSALSGPLSSIFRVKKGRLRIYYPASTKPGRLVFPTGKCTV